MVGEETSRLLYAVLLVAVALQRLGELAVSRRNVRRLLARGGIESGAADYRWMVVMHSLFLLSCALEVFLMKRPFLPALGMAMTGLLAGTMAIRFWVIRTLGGRWTTRVVTLPGSSRVTTGPYRWMRHPNYAAVGVELVAIPLIHTAVWTAVLFSGVNFFILRRRIRTEETALQSAYGAAD